MKTLIFCLLLVVIVASCNLEAGNFELNEGAVIPFPKHELQDKIKGGWAGQVIGCTYGGPTEFQWNGTMIGDHVPIPWDDNRMLWYFENSPGLYDDVYMDLTFVDVFERFGLDAPDSLHALAFANAEYPLWHANQAARYNILNGIMPPASGHWKNNPHADDIDFQIEADFAGLMAPGMANSAADIGNRIGHIMNYGDGVYGGIFVAAMYSLAFIFDDIEKVVEEALLVIPPESEFFKCIQDVLDCYHENPADWKQAWFEAQKKWTYDIGCPDGVFRPFNIDAKINAAYIVIGLLYGKGDYGATVDISTRCGYDSDCNPANAAGILGTMIGYNKIPDYWKQGLEKVEHLDFKYTSMSLHKVYEIGYSHALEMIKRGGGKEEGDNVLIRFQKPKTVPLEVAFEGIFPIERKRIGRQISKSNPELSFEIQGSGFILGGRAIKDSNMPDIVLEVDVFAGDQLLETVKMPTSSVVRRHEISWNYELPEGIHQIKAIARKISDGYRIEAGDVVIYSGKQPESRVYFN